MPPTVLRAAHDAATVTGRASRIDRSEVDSASTTTTTTEERQVPNALDALLARRPYSA